MLRLRYNKTVDVTNYEAPISFNKELDERVLKFFNIKSQRKSIFSHGKEPQLVLNTKTKVNIAIIGKYGTQDAYKSLDEALTHGGIANNLKVNLVGVGQIF